MLSYCLLHSWLYMLCGYHTCSYIGDFYVLVMARYFVLYKELVSTEQYYTTVGFWVETAARGTNLATSSLFFFVHFMVESSGLPEAH